jgi:excisionase family DNA binding protein
MRTHDGANLPLSTPEFLRRSLTPREFARRVGVSPTTVHKWLEEGLPSGMIGARRLIHIDTADTWLKTKLGIKPDIVGNEQNDQEHTVTTGSNFSGLPLPAQGNTRGRRHPGGKES